MTGQTVADILLHASLTENYLYIEDAPVSGGQAGGFVALRDDGGAGTRNHLLTVDSNGDLLHFAQDPTSASGWRTTTVPVPAPGGAARISGAARIFSVTAFIRGGELNALCLFRTDPSAAITPAYAVSWVVRANEGSWSAAAVTPEAAGFLSLVSQVDCYLDPSGTPWIYGVAPPPLGVIEGASDYLYPDTALFFVLYYDQQNATWDEVASVQSKQLNTQEPFRLQILSNGGPQPTVVWIDQQNVQWASVTLATPESGGLVWQGQSNSEAWGDVFSNPIVRVVPFPGNASVDSVLLVDSANNVFYAQFLSGVPYPDVQPLIFPDLWPLNGVTSVALCATPGASAAFHLFVIDSTTSELWVTPIDPSAVSPDWRRLGNKVAAIAVPGTVASGLELFIASQDTYEVFHMSQNATDNVWIQQKLAAPASDEAAPRKIAALSMHTVAVDSGGARVPHAQYSVASDQWVNLVVPAETGSVSWWTGPGGTPATFGTDATGEATVLFHAQSLAMPKLTFTATGQSGQPDGGATRWCQGDVVEVRQGETAEISPSSVASRLAGSDTLFPVNNDELVQRNLLSANSPDYAAASSSVTQVGHWMLSQNTAPNVASGPREPRSFRLERTPSGMRCRELGAAESRRMLAAGSGSVGSAFSDAVGDITNWAKHAGGELEHVTLTIGDSFVVAFGDLKSFAVSTVRQASDVLEAYFVHLAMAVEDIVAVIKEVIEWLMLLFDWDDIVNTHVAIKTVVNSLLTFVSDGADDLRAVVKKELAGLQSTIQDQLANIANVTEFQQSFNAFANAAGASATAYGSGNNVLDNGAQRAAFHDRQTQCLFVYGHAKSHVFQPASMALAPGSSTDNFVATAGKNWPPASVDNASGSVRQKFVGSSVPALLDAGIADLVVALQELITLAFTGIEDIADALLTAIGDTVATLTSALNHTIDIPVISWLYLHYAKAPLTALDLFCLICAVPVTIIYKVLNGGTAPFSAAEAKTLTLPWPNLSLSRPDLPRVPETSSPAIYATLGRCGAFLGIISGFISETADQMAFNAEESPSWGTTIVSWASSLVSLASTGLEGPFATFTQPADTWSTADILATVLWGTNVFCDLYDLLGTFAFQRMVRFLAPGPGIDTCTGVILLTVGCTTAVFQIINEDHEQLNAWDAVNSVVPQLNRPFRFLIADKNEITQPLSKSAIGIIDTVICFAGALTEFEAIELG